MVWYFIWPAPHPKYVHPPGTIINFFHLRVFEDFGQKFPRTPVCLMSAYTGPTFSERRAKHPNYVLMQFWAKFFPKILGLNSKEKNGHMAILGTIFKRKNFFKTFYGTSSKHHRRCLEVQRTRLKRFLILEHRWGL